MMCPDIICAGEMLVEIMRAEVGVPHLQVGGVYKGPYPSGAPAIFIDSAARMGKSRKISTGFIGVIGNDDFGRVIVDKLVKDGVDTSGVRVDPGKTTGVAFVQYNPDGSRKFIFAAGAAGQLQPADIKAPAFKGVKCFHVMGSALSISPLSNEATLKAMDAALAQKAKISFDPNLRPEMMALDEILKICKPVIRKTSILLPSGEEATMLTGDKDARAACETLLGMGPAIVVLKEGKGGCTVFSKDGGTEKVTGFKVTEVDPTGAGDSFGGAFIVEHLAGMSLAESARFANAVGALKVTSFGPMASHARGDVEKFMKKSA